MKMKKRRRKIKVKKNEGDPCDGNYGFYNNLIVDFYIQWNMLTI